MNVKNLFVVWVLFMASPGFAQCKSGDCNNGRGVYDFGWCRYEGTFKNGKPEGQGKMTYDDGTYEGSFRNGVEDGQGVYVYKSGRKEKVVYQNGVKIAFEPVPVTPGSLQSFEGNDRNCLNGNCVTGRGTYRYASGNEYTGDFVDHKRHGKGRVRFANKDEAEGDFRDNNIISGTYRFADGNVFRGKWNEKGDMYDGVFTSPRGVSVVLQKGKVIAPEPAQVARGGGGSSGELNCTAKISCPHCHGKGIENKPIVKTHSFTVTSGYTHNSLGERTGTWYEGGTTRSTTEIPNYEVCSRCAGRGEICK